MIGASETCLRKKVVKSDLNDVNKDLKGWITELELLWGDSLDLGMKIDDEIMTHILSNLPEE